MTTRVQTLSARIAIFGFFVLLCGISNNPAWSQGNKPQNGESQDENPQETRKSLDVLFLGDRAGHQPRVRFSIIQPVLAKRGINLTYTDNVDDLNSDKLSHYDALLVYANIDQIEPDQEKALLEYVAGGGGFVPIHCATYCFRNSDDIIALMGAQFQRHQTGVFRSTIVQVDHPVMQGFGGFESWDETYVHHRHNETNRTVLSYRVDREGREPWTWVRTHGTGRVFYTAWGHDERTWGNAGFQNLLERGIRWATHSDPASVPDFQEDLPFPVPQIKSKRTDVQPFEYVDAGGKIPNYTPSRQWGIQGEPFTKMQKPLPAEESMKHIVVPEKFSVKLFASEPEIGGKPIAMAWDERGRLWVCETYDYPNGQQPIGQGRDRIRILEDTDGDWVADKFTVFAEQLSIPTSIAFYRGGAIVQNGTQTIYLKDTDGDDVADERRLLFDGWGQGDTHGGVSNFQYGLDNSIWAMQGYNSSAPTIEGVKPQRFNQGFFRFRPDGSKLEFLRSTNNNTWGLGIAEDGVIFGSTANGNPSVYLPIPNRYYERVKGWTRNLQLGSIADTDRFKPITDKVRQVDYHGRYTAAAGHAIYTARQYPREYWNRVAFVNGPTGHLVGAFVITPQGSDYQSSSPFNLFASDDEWTAPIMTEIGPDGNAWVIDWYNYIVQHNPTPQGFKTGKGNAYESTVRDKKHGRIYRIVYGDPASTPFTLADASPEKLVKTLSHPTMLWRKHAQRLLVERGNLDVVPALIQLIDNKSVDEIGLNVGAIHALWTWHGLVQKTVNGKTPDGPTSPSVIHAALKHPSAAVRRNAIQTLPINHDSTAAVISANLLSDTNPQVRLAALLALSDLPPSESAAAAIVKAIVSGDVGDRWLKDAAISAAANHAGAFLSQVAKSKPSPDLLQATRIVADHYGRTGPGETIATLFKSLNHSDPEITRSILAGIAVGWPDEVVPELTDAFESDLETLLESLPMSQRSVLVLLGRQWNSSVLTRYAKEVTQSFYNELDDQDAVVARRIDAAQKLVDFMPNSDQVVVDLLERISPQTSPELAVGIVSAMGASRSADVGKTMTSKMDQFSPRMRSTAIRILLGRPETTGDLLASMGRGEVLISELSVDQRAGLLDHPVPNIRRRARRILRQGGALPDADRQKVLTSLLTITQQKGDVANGKEIFVKNCANCHTHNGEGQEIGPDLTGVSVHPKSELLTHIIDPSRDVEGNFRIYKVLTLDGKLINGLLASESKTTIEMYDSEGKKQVLLREDIDEMVISRKSLMPDGFEKQISASGMTDLLEFLTARGKYVPLDLSKTATLPTDRGMFYDSANQGERLLFNDWSPKTFNQVPFNLITPQDGKIKNAIVLYGPIGGVSKTLPRRVEMPFNGPAKAIHLLSGISGWGHPYSTDQTVSMIVRIHYSDGEVEDHELKNGVHFSDYIRRINVPESEFAFSLRGHQLRYLVIHPRRPDSIAKIEFVKGPDSSSPIVMAVTVETPNSDDSEAPPSRD